MKSVTEEVAPAGLSPLEPLPWGMCGRYVIYGATARLAEAFHAEPSPGLTERLDAYNAAPGAVMPVIRTEATDEGEQSRRRLHPMRWGLIPSWSREEKTPYSLFNARSETAAEKPSFREPLRHRRCLVPANGFYEWEKTPSGKQPHYIQARSDSPLSAIPWLAFAGLYDRWKDPNRPDGPVLETFTILTTAASRDVASLHDRMPAILLPEEQSLWLDPGVQDPHLLGDLLHPCGEYSLRTVPVSREVNDARHQGAHLIDPIAG